MEINVYNQSLNENMNHLTHQKYLGKKRVVLTQVTNSFFVDKFWQLL